MNFRAYNELRLKGHSPEAAIQMIAEGYTPVGMYEQKSTVDNGSHRGGKVPCIGLKPEFKTILIQLKEQSMLKMPYATAFTLMKNAGIEHEEAHAAAGVFQDVPFADETEALLGMGKFIETYERDEIKAFAYLEEVQAKAKTV